MHKKNNNWYQSIVFYGNQQGKKLGFPTLNLDPTVLPENQKEGVYAATLDYEDKHYKAALYFGPRVVLGESHRVLELYVLDFAENIYDKTIAFQIREFIRDVKNFSSLTKMKQQIENDVKKIRAL